MPADFSELIAFRDKLQGAIDDSQTFLESCVKELAARLLAQVVKNTLPGIYPPSTGKVGGNLRRGWTAGQDIDVRQYIEGITVTRVGDNFVIELINPVEYAMYVEYGHRTSNHKGWVDGKFTLTVAEKDIQTKAPAILEKKFAEVFKSD